jgi:hypothetical protein
MAMLERGFIIRLVLIVTIATSALGSCAPTYDDIADKMLADTQKQADDGLLKLESLARTIEAVPQNADAKSKKAIDDAKEKAGYAANMAFYDGLQSSLSALADRMTALDDLTTPSMSNALSKLEANVEEMRTLHAKQDILSAAYVRSARQILDQQFKTLTVYELTLKSGAKPK